MKLFTAMEDYSNDESLTYTLEELDVIEMNLNNEQRVLDSAVESYLDASSALKCLVKLEGLSPRNRGVYNVTMESINDQLGYPEGTVLASEGVGESISKFAKNVWAKIVAAYHAVRDWIRKLFGMAPIPSKESLKKTDDIIKEAADKGPTIKTDDSKSGDDTQLEKDILNSVEGLVVETMDDIDQKLEEAAKVRDDKLAVIAKKKGMQTVLDAEARGVTNKFREVTKALVKESKERAERIKVNLQRTYDEHEQQAHYIDSNKFRVDMSTKLYEKSEQARHPKAYDIEMGIALSTVLKATKVSILMVTDDNTMKTRYATDDIKIIMPFLNDHTNNEMTNSNNVTTFDGFFFCEPVLNKGTRIRDVRVNPGGNWDVSYVNTGEHHDRIVANHKWFKVVVDNINLIMEKLTPEHFLYSENAVLLGKMLAADLNFVGRKKASLMRQAAKNNELVKVIMEDTNEATYRYLQDHYIARDTDHRNIKG